MSLYEFFPMKKRKVCKTPTSRRGTCTSTLGKLKKQSESFTSNGGENGIEILWDNNSPSPTTSIALASKRRRKQPTTKAEETPLTDVSFVVQKLSENTSPVVDRGHPALLEMWINKPDEKKNIHLCHDDEFTSPPFPQNTSPFSTPLIQRRTSKRQSRKASKQFMLEIRKLVDEIQKNDLSSSSQSQKEIQSKSAEDRAQTKRAKNDESSKMVKLGDQSLTSKCQPGNKKLSSSSGPGTSISGLNATITDRLMDDSFDWTEDDMDELILTCQLSSSGHGSLTVPDAPKPKFGSSPSQVTFVPETQITQMQSRANCAKPQMKPETKPCSQGTQILFPSEQLDNNKLKKVVLDANHVAERAQEVPQQNDLDVWDLNFDEDDSLLASAAQEFELSQEAMAKPRCSPKKEGSCPINDDFSLFESLKGETNHKDSLALPANKNYTRKENQNSKNSNDGSTFEQPLKTSVPTARNSSHFTKIKCFSKKLDENSHKTCPSQNNDLKPVLEGTKIPPTKVNSSNGNVSRQMNKSTRDNSGCEWKVVDVNSKQFNKAPTIQKKSLTEKGNGGKQINRTKGTLEISSGKSATPGKNLSLIRTTLSGKKAFENLTNMNENRFPRNNVHTQGRGNEGFSSPLQSKPGNVSYREKHASQVKTNLGKSKETSLKSLSQTNEDHKSNQKKNLLQNNKGQENEFDFLLCEENFAALFDDFNFEDVLTEATTQASTNTKDSFTNKSEPTPNAVTQKKCSKDEIERKRLEAQRRRLAKVKEKPTTQLSYARIYKR